MIFYVWALVAFVVVLYAFVLSLLARMERVERNANRLESEILARLREIEDLADACGFERQADWRVRTWRKK